MYGYTEIYTSLRIVRYYTLHYTPTGEAASVYYDIDNIESQ